nr:hypothetical protein [Sediminispirochaeta smaragdinae]
MRFNASLSSCRRDRTGDRRTTLYLAIHERVLSLHKLSRVHTVLVLDEGHLLSNGMLKELRLLSNYEIDFLNGDLESRMSPNSETHLTWPARAEFHKLP